MHKAPNIGQNASSFPRRHQLDNRALNSRGPWPRTGLIMRRWAVFIAAQNAAVGLQGLNAAGQIVNKTQQGRDLLLLGIDLIAKLCQFGLHLGSCFFQLLKPPVLSPGHAATGSIASKSSSAF